MELVSITIPVYNDGEGLRKSLLSLKEQTYDNWEAIVVDDGSILSLHEIINEFKDKRIKFFRFDKNFGRPTARQKTLEIANGEFIGFLDAGDSYVPDFIQNAINVFLKYDVLAVSQSIVIKYQMEYYYSNYPNKIINIKSNDYQLMSFASTIFKSNICKNHKFNMKLKYSQDRHFLNDLALSSAGDIYLMNSYGYIYDQGSDMKLRTTWRKYYYDIIRLLSDNKIFGSLLLLMKMFFMTTVHLLFGYKKVLSIRFKRK